MKENNDIFITKNIKYTIYILTNNLISLHYIQNHRTLQKISLYGVHIYCSLFNYQFLLLISFPTIEIKHLLRIKPFLNKTPYIIFLCQFSKSAHYFKQLFIPTATIVWLYINPIAHLQCKAHY